MHFLYIDDATNAPDVLSAHPTNSRLHRLDDLTGPEPPRLK